MRRLRLTSFFLSLVTAAAASAPGAAAATSDCSVGLEVLQPIAPEARSPTVAAVVAAPVDVIPAALATCLENANPSPPVILVTLTRADGTDVPVTSRSATYWVGSDRLVEMVPSEPLVLGETYTSTFAIEGDERLARSTFQIVEASPPPAAPTVELLGATWSGDHIEARLDVTWPDGPLLHMMRLETLPSGRVVVGLDEAAGYTRSLEPGDDDTRFCATALVRDAAGRVAEAEPACGTIPSSGCSVGPADGGAHAFPAVTAVLVALGLRRARGGRPRSAR